MMRRAAGSIVVVTVLSLAVVSGAYAQGEVAAPNEKGVPPNRDYLALLPFDVIDTASNNLILRFTDLVLPGNAGRSVQIERVFSNSTFGVGWRMGIAGVPMRVVEPLNRWLIASDFNVPWDLQQERRHTPAFQTLEGGAIRTTYWAQPTIDQASQYLVRGSNFGQYRRDTRILLQPDGTRATYCAGTEPGCPGEGYLKELSDPFGNTVTLTWEATGEEAGTGYVTARLVSLTQDLGGGSSREVTFGASPDPRMPGSMTYLGRTWQYGFVDGALRTVTPPVGPGWTFEYSTAADLSQGKVTDVTTPQGGTVHYTWADRRYPVVAPGALILGEPVPFNVLVQRDTNDLQQAAQTWTFEPLGLETSPFTQVVRPDGTELLYFYQPADPNTVLDGAWQLERVEVRANGVTVETDAREYEYLQAARTPASNALWGLSQPIRRTITRMGTTHTTEYAYGSVGAHFHNYHNPTTITERGPDGAVRRTTTRTYTHLAAMPSTPYLLALPASEAVTEAGVTTSSSRTYAIATGFRETETVDGFTTTFTPDARGNVATLTKANGKAIEMTYQSGVVKDVTTQAGVNTTRTINPDGTVDSETIANRTTSYQYDALSRRTELHPPGGTAPIITSYTTGQSTTMSRGSAFLRTDTDGFGRPVRTENAAGVRTRTSYDGIGRVVYQSHAFTGGFNGSTDVGTSLTYDALGRLTQEMLPDGATRTRTYDDTNTAVTVRDEEGRQTVLTYRGYGHPDDARLVTVVDAANQTWAYTYDVRGNLAQVSTPTGHTRTWTRNSTSGLLTSETHPESGQTTYAEYDAAGILKRKVDANGTAFVYSHDGDDRVTSITSGTRVTNIAYEPGSNNRIAASTSSVGTLFFYDDAGRLRQRQDAIDGKLFNSQYEYVDDNLTAIVYPSGRRVEYNYNTENQITKVSEPAAPRDYASSLTYHPSGGLATGMAGDGSSSVLTYHQNRYWPETITTVLPTLQTWSLGYGNYDGVGNVRSITDSRSGMDQTFTYDVLDRLTQANGPYGPITYAYDAHGNRQTNSSGTYTLDPNTLRLTEQNGIPFTYDNNGNLRTAGPAGYTYTPTNMLETANVVGGTATYVYDADDARVKSTFGGSTSYYLRGANGELLTEWKDPGSSTGLVRDYIYAGSRLISRVDKSTNDDPNNHCGTIIPGGPSITLSVLANQNPCLMFSGTPGQRVSVLVTNNSISIATFSILRPNQTELFSTSMFGGSGLLDVQTLADPGTDTLVVDPWWSNTGTATLTMYNVPADVTAAITPGGPAVTVTTTVPGQNARLTFNGVTGQRVSLKLTNVTIPYSDVFILRPDGSTLASLSGGNGFLDTQTLATTGTYAVLVNPRYEFIGSATLTLYDVPADVSGTIVPGGSAVQVTTTVPGQNVRLTFSGTMGQRISLLLTNVTIPYSDVDILKPDGSSLASFSGSGGFIDTTTLPSTGTYTVQINPRFDYLGSATLALYDVPADSTATVTIGGSSATLTVSTPGQSGTVTFAGNAGQQATVHLTGNTIGLTTVLLRKPDGGSMTSTFWWGSSFDLATQTLPTTGTYTVVVDPYSTNTGNITVAVTSP
jgi:YD repeat-containing protein